MIPYRTFPEIDLGLFELRTFGLMTALGVLVGIQLLVRHVRNHGLDPDSVTSLAIRIVLIGFVGSRITWVLSHLGEIDSPVDVVAVWDGGIQFSGGFLFAAAYLLWWLRRHPMVPRLILADGFAYGLTGGLIFGRIGCYSVGEHLGGETDFFLGTEYLGGDTIEGSFAVGTTIHNTSLYEALGLAVLLVVLELLRRRSVPPGWLLTTFALWYGVQRFITDSFREFDNRTFGLTGAQYMTLALFAFGVWFAVRLRARTRAGGPVAATA